MSSKTVLLVYVALAIGCSGGKDVALAPRFTDDDVRREFLEIAERLRAGDNQYFGRRPLEDLRAELAEESLEDPKRFFQLLRLTDLETKQGLMREATAHADEAVALVAEPASLSKPDSELRKALAAAHMVRALAYLRLAEQQNCVAHPMDRSCIFPIEGNGVYANPVAAEEALAGLRKRQQFRRFAAGTLGDRGGRSDPHRRTPRLVARLGHALDLP